MNEIIRQSPYKTPFYLRQLYEKKGNGNEKQM
jgi:hypothetical protein